MEHLHQQHHYKTVSPKRSVWGESQHDLLAVQRPLTTFGLPRACCSISLFHDSLRAPRHSSVRPATFRQGPLPIERVRLGMLLSPLIPLHSATLLSEGHQLHA